MRRTLCSLVLLFGAVACSSTAADDKEKPKEGGKGAVVTLDGLRSRAPAGWKEEAPSNKMRFAQFRIPKAKDDNEDGELIIFKGLGGTAKANVDRWKKQFQAPAGKKIEDAAKVEEIKIAGRNATLLDVSGTYLYNPQPFNPRSKTERRPGYRMLAIHFDGPDNVYHIKFTAPAATVEAHKKAFDEWIKGFKKE
jgi:hypothetical protein